LPTNSEVRNDVCSAFGNWKIKKRSRFDNTIAQSQMPSRHSFHNLTVHNIHPAFCKGKTMDDDQKKFFPQLAIDTEWFLCAFVNPFTMCAFLCIWP